MNSITGLKRIGNDITQIDGQPLNKKQKKNVTENSPLPSFLSLPSDCLRRIALFLPTEYEILNFELLFKQAIEYTDLAWEKFAKQECLDFDWTLPHNERYSQRARYLHGKVLSVYLASRKKITLNNQCVWVQPTFSEVNKLFGDFQGIMKRYPSSIGAYLWQDLNHLTKLSSSNDSLFQKNCPSEPKVPLTAGDLLLKGLSYLSAYPANTRDTQTQQEELRRSAFNSLNKAILKGASCASSLAIQTLIGKFQNPEWYYNLAVVSLTAQQDYRGLDFFLRTFQTQATLLYKQGICYPPILVQIAKSKPPKEAEPLFDKAIKGYRNHVPSIVLHMAAGLQIRLANYEKAEEYADKAILACGNDVPGGTWIHASVIQLNLKNDKKAEEYANKAILAYGNDVPGGTWHHAAIIQLKLANHKKAEEYADKAILAYGNDVPGGTWHHAAHIQLKLANHKKAEEYADKAILAYGNDVPGLTWHHAAHIQLNLKNDKKAEEYANKAILSYGNDVPGLTWHNAAHIQLNLKNDKKAEEYIDKAILAYGNDVPGLTWHHAAIIQLKLANHKKAEEYADKAILAYGNDVPGFVWHDVSHIQISLENYKKAAEYSDKAILAYGNDVPGFVWQHAADIQLKLANHKKAEESSDKAIL